MRATLQRLPAFIRRFEEDVKAYIRQVARVSQENFEEIENAINANDANNTGKMMSWIGL